MWEQPGTEKPVLEPMFAAGFHGIELAFALLAEFISDGRRCGGDGGGGCGHMRCGVFSWRPPADKLLQTSDCCAGMSPSGREWSWLLMTLPHRYSQLLGSQRRLGPDDACPPALCACRQLGALIGSLLVAALRSASCSLRCVMLSWRKSFRRAPPLPADSHSPRCCALTVLSFRRASPHPTYLHRADKTQR